jgi:voltage-gated potassium channel
VPVTSSGRIGAAIFAHFWIFAILPLIASDIIMRVIEDKHRFTDQEQLILFERVERMKKLLESINKK